MEDKSIEIVVGQKPFEGSLSVSVRYYEQRNGKGWSGEVTVWVPASDSRAEIERLARAEAAAFLRRSLEAHSAEDPAEQP